MSEVRIDKFVPDWTKKCDVCEQSPVVIGIRNKKVVYDNEMCGPCTFGTAKALDTDWWNGDNDE